MIVISGALVLVALVLLVIGLVSTALGFVYASIAVSVVSFLFLIVGILQRRGETTSDTAAATALAAPASDVEGVTAIIPAARRPDPEPTPVAPSLPATAPSVTSSEQEGTVLVVEGRPRYHVEGCRYLTGKDASVVPVTEARADGYTACGVCKPDDALAAVAASAPEQAVAEPAAEPAADESTAEVPDTAAAAPRTARKAPAKKAATKAVKAPAKTAAAKAPAKKAAAKKAPASSGGPTVVVIPDRGKYHQPDCRFVRDASGTEELSKSQATRQGYQACGVCKP